MVIRLQVNKKLQQLFQISAHYNDQHRCDRAKISEIENRRLYIELTKIVRPCVINNLSEETIFMEFSVGY